MDYNIIGSWIGGDSLSITEVILISNREARLLAVTLMPSESENELLEALAYKGYNNGILFFHIVNKEFKVGMVGGSRMYTPLVVKFAKDYARARGCIIMNSRPDDNVKYVTKYFLPNVDQYGNNFLELK